MNVDAVLFDADGVLQWPGARRRPWLQEAFGCTPEELGLWQKELFRIEDRALTGAADFEHGVRALLAERSCPGTWEMVLRAWTAIEVDEAVLDLVARLEAANVRCFLASNQERHRAESMSTALGFASVFDAEFYSCALGEAKPDAAFFTAILKVTKLAADQTLFVDDRQENVDAARGVGMRAERVDVGSVVRAVERAVGWR